MQSSNPVLSRDGAFTRGGYATFGQAPPAEQLQEMYDAPAYTGTRPMTIDDVVMRTGLLLAIVAGVGGLSWYLNVGFGVAIVAALAGFGVAMVVTFKRVLNPGLVVTYAALEGVFLGVISHVFNDMYPGIVVQAVLGTGAAFAGMLFAYKSGKIRVTPRFTKILIGATLGFLGLAVINLVASFFVDGGLGLRGDSGILPLLFGAAGVVLASLFLALDFHLVEEGIKAGAPEKESWLAAFGLTVTLVWLYLEMLRLIAVLRGE
ncbi:MAG: Bax inhibitor-1/YccA family protein [Actinomycetes bacterium]